MMTQLSKLLNIAHEDAFTINKNKGFLVDLEDDKKDALGKEDEEMAKKEEKKSGQQ